MLVRRIVLPASALESWTVLGDDAAPVEPIERYLAYLSDIERSSNTVKAYAHDLKDWFFFLGIRGLDWREVRLEDVGEFVAWLRLPPLARSGAVAVLPSVDRHCGEATVNRKLSAVSAFYQHAARHGVGLGDLLNTWQPAGRRGTAWKPFLHHVSKGQPQARRAIRLRAPRKHPRILTVAEVQTILDERRTEARSSLADVDQADTAEGFELPGADLSGEELSVRVVPKQADEFTCSVCFLVHHRHRHAGERAGLPICRDCVA